MKTAFLLLSICASASAFGVHSSSRQSSIKISTTELSALVDKADMSADQLKMMEMRETWNTIRHLSYDEIPEDVGDEYKEAHKRYFEKYEKDMDHYKEIAEKLQVILEPPKVAKKTKGQRKRDKWAKVQAREAARAANK